MTLFEKISGYIRSVGRGLLSFAAIPPVACKDASPGSSCWTCADLHSINYSTTNDSQKGSLREEMGGGAS